MQHAVFHSGVAACLRNDTLRIRLRIHRFQVFVVHHDVLLYPIARILPEVQRHFHVLFQILIDCKNYHFFFFAVVYDHTIQIRRLAVLLRLIDGRLHDGIQNRALSQRRRMHIRIKDGLSPCSGIGGHDRRDYIDKLRKTADLHTVRMSEHGDQHTAHQKRIFEIIDIFQLVRLLDPFLQLLVRLIGVIPYIPLVQ